MYDAIAHMYHARHVATLHMQPSANALRNHAHVVVVGSSQIIGLITTLIERIKVEMSLTMFYEINKQQASDKLG